MIYFNGFLAYTKQVSCPVLGESYVGVESVVVQDDAINIASVVRRMQRGEIVPLKQLPYGDDTASDADLVDVECEMRERLAVSASSSNNSEISEDVENARVRDSHKDKPASPNDADVKKETHD